ncbi:MAG: Arm DNA-binding domain-containing protein, partial [Burkholderiales bacterium]
MNPGVYMASTQASNHSVKLTKSAIDRLAPPATGQAFYRDSELKGFALRMTASGARAFVLEKRIDGRPKRLTLGRYGELTVEQARRQAQKFLGQLAMGENPIADKEREQLRSLTLEQIFADFKRARAGLRPVTLYQY